MSPPREISIRSIISTGLSRFPSIPRARESVWNLVMHVSADRTRAINLKDPRKDGGKDQEIRDRPSFSPRHGSTMRHFSCCRICFPIFGQHYRSSIFRFGQSEGNTLDGYRKGFIFVIKKFV